MIVTLIRKHSSIITPYLCGFFIGIFVLIWSSQLKKPPYVKKAPAQKTRISDFFQNRRFLVFLLFSFTIHLTFTSTQNYMPWLIEAVHADKTLFGAISGFKVLFEAGMLFFGAKIIKSVSLPKILILAGCFFLLENY